MTRMCLPSNTPQACSSSPPKAEALAQVAPALSYRNQMKHLLAACLVVCTYALSAPVAQARDIVVFAAASLKNAFDDAAEAFEASTGTGVVVSYAGSSALARQIEQGAPADVFASANQAWMDHLTDLDLIVAPSEFELARNRLVLIGETDGPVPLTKDGLTRAFAPDTRLAMGLVSAVPAGIYGKSALTSLGLWDTAAPFVVQTENVRAALRLVSLGEAQFGVVYATDAQVDEGVHVRAAFPEDSHVPIAYPTAITAESTHPDVSAFVSFLASETAQAIFQSHGFLPGEPS